MFPDRAAAVLFVIAFLLWAVFEAFNTLGLRFFQQNTHSQRRDRGSYWVIVLIVWGSLLISFLLRALDWGAFHGSLQYLGIGMIYLGIAFREWAVFSLGRFFSVTVTIADGQPLVQRGPYRWLRHPAYSGSILSLVGFPLAIGTWAGGLLVLSLSLAGFLYRLNIEEKALLSVFGDEYRAYMQHTWRLFPGL